MSGYLIQAPDSKRWHIGVFVGPLGYVGQFLPACNVDPDKDGLWRMQGSSKRPDLKWRTPHGICTNCAREVESAVRLIAAEEEAG